MRVEGGEVALQKLTQDKLFETYIPMAPYNLKSSQIDYIGGIKLCTMQNPDPLGISFWNLKIQKKYLLVT